MVTAAADVQSSRLRAQLLSGSPATGVVPVVERLLAVQAQDLVGARLAVRARSRALQAADVDRALTVDRSVVVSWLNRGTLHLVRAEDYPWLHALTTPQLATANARRLAQEGVSPAAAELGVRVVRDALAHGPLTRGALRERLDAAGVPTAGQALVHTLFLATLRGHVVRGPVVGAEQAFVLVHDWLGPQPAVERAAALRELAARYLAGHGPAGDRDLARWANIPLRDARAGLRALGPRVQERPDGLLDLAGRRPVRGMPPPRLLGSFEPVLLGWTSREEITGPHTGLVTVNGIFKPFAMVGGRAVGSWSRPGGRVTLQPFAPLADDVAAALARDALAVEAFLG